MSANRFRLQTMLTQPLDLSQPVTVPLVHNLSNVGSG